MKIIILLLLALALGQCYQGNPEQCLKDAAEIAVLAAEVAVDVKTFNFAKLKKDFVRLESLLNQTREDCGKGTMEKFNFELKFNPVQCVEDVLAIVELITNITNDVQTFNLPQLEADVTALEAQLTKAGTDCSDNSTNVELPSKIDVQFEALTVLPLQLAVTENYFQIQAKADPATCIQDVEKIASLAEQIVVDIKTLNFNQLKTDVVAMEGLLEQASKDCAEGILFGNSLNPAKCLEDVFAIGKLVPQVENDVKTKAWGQLVKDVEALVPLLVEAKTDCSQ